MIPLPHEYVERAIAFISVFRALQTRYGVEVYSDRDKGLVIANGGQDNRDIFVNGSAFGLWDLSTLKKEGAAPDGPAL